MTSLSGLVQLQELDVIVIPPFTPSALLALTGLTALTHLSVAATQPPVDGFTNLKLTSQAGNGVCLQV